jgi:hypothetical protein
MSIIWWPSEKVECWTRLIKYLSFKFFMHLTSWQVCSQTLRSPNLLSMKLETYPFQFMLSIYVKVTVYKKIVLWHSNDDFTHHDVMKNMPWGIGLRMFWAFIHNFCSQNISIMVQFTIYYNMFLSKLSRKVQCLTTDSWVVVTM